MSIKITTVCDGCGEIINPDKDVYFVLSAEGKVINDDDFHFCCNQCLVNWSRKRQAP
jgi:hypothetical protein